jgi:hypothetical protein
MATIVVSLSPVGAPTTPRRPAPTWDPARSVQEAWETSLRLVQAVADAGIRVAVFSWWLLPLGLAAWAVWTSLRRPRRAEA